MEARALPVRRSSWLSGILPLILLGGAILLFVGLDAPGLERRGIPIEDVAVERTTLRPGVIELRFPHAGSYMFHAHVSEFAELGWMGFFEVV